MRDRTTQYLINLTYESLGTAQQVANFLSRLQPLAPHLVGKADIITAQQRVDRLKSMLRGLQQAKQD